MYTLGNLQHFMHTALPRSGAPMMPLSSNAVHFLASDQFSNAAANALREYIAYMGNIMLALPHVSGRVGCKLTSQGMALCQV